MRKYRIDRIEVLEYAGVDYRHVWHWNSLGVFAAEGVLTFLEDPTASENVKLQVKRFEGSGLAQKIVHDRTYWYHRWSDPDREGFTAEIHDQFVAPFGYVPPHKGCKRLLIHCLRPEVQAGE